MTMTHEQDIARLRTTTPEWERTLLTRERQWIRARNKPRHNTWLEMFSFAAILFVSAAVVGYFLWATMNVFLKGLLQ